MIRTELYPTGRKHCSRCRCWRPLQDFGPHSSHPGVLKSQCRTCERLERRAERGQGRAALPGQRRQTHCKQGHELTPENVYVRARPLPGRTLPQRECLICLSQNRRKPLTREWRRFYMEARRREAGIKPRSFKSRATPRRRGEARHLPVEPFREWLEDLIAAHGMDEARRRTGLNERRIYAARYEDSAVDLDTVDAALTREGSTFLWELYPSLYADEVAA